MVEMTPATPAARTIRYRQVDVFSERPMAGNGLAVVQSTEPLDSSLMLEVTRELRQFETIFLHDVSGAGARARIFTPEEELAFAGHPVLGAASVLHWEHASAAQADWSIVVAGRSLHVVTRHDASTNVVHADMNQGPAEFLRTLSRTDVRDLAGCFSLTEENLRRDLPSPVVSTGLPYVLLPVNQTGLEACRVVEPDLRERLIRFGADFVYVFDPDVPEGRTWDNAGLVEDVATGSAAGPVGAYLLELGLHPPGSTMVVHQGRFLGRPSTMRVRRDEGGAMWVGGPVVPFGSGTLESSIGRDG
jgi:trans-2,3-dihydro-3-hydroxyanthranilate isomerase